MMLGLFVSRLKEIAFTFVLVALAALAVVPDLHASSSGREICDLDGIWDFCLDESGRGEKDGWYSADVPFPHTIQVPGCWDTQGFGWETDKLRHNFIGKAWYKRTVEIPASWTGKRIFLCIGNVHRYAKVWVNDTYFGEHIGYLSPFEYEVTRFIQPGEPATITICVDSEQRWDVDPLTGCVDIIDAMDLHWGGIWGHVSLEGRGDAWLSDLFIQPKISPTGCTVSAKLNGETQAFDCVRLDILDRRGHIVKSVQGEAGTVLDESSVLHFNTTIPDGELWTTDTPVLYTACVTLWRNEAMVDRLETRFGLREIEIRGHNFHLNGKILFLRGYGDDSIYPATMAPPADKAFYHKRLKTIKEYGFMHVRHHSHLLPPEYYEACDEIGMLVSAEFPIAYGHFYDRATPAGLELYKREWEAAIRRYRNHPSIFDWSMCNEISTISIAEDLYRIAKELDPTRPVIDTDGIWGNEWIDGKSDRATLDFFSYGFDVFQIPLDVPHKFQMNGTPVKPVIFHEQGNFGTFPRLDQIERFRDNMKPFWLTPARERLAALGLLDEADRWAECSERLFVLCHKLDLEALRKNDKITGHHFWLFQDYWTGSNGIVDFYFRPKAIQPREIKEFVNDVVLLEEGLALTYRGGERMNLQLGVSNFAPQGIADAKLTWKIAAGGKTLERDSQESIHPPQGKYTPVATASCVLPNVDRPTPIRIEVELHNGKQVYRNHWTSRLYPREIDVSPLGHPLYVDAQLMPWFQSMGARTIPGDGVLPVHAVYVVQQLDGRLVDAVAGGATLVALAPVGVFPAIPNRFKTTWWLGNASDCNVGTVVYDNPVTRDMATEGWCDQSWYRLLEGSSAYILENLPGKPDVLVRALDTHLFARDKALLFQARVGQGVLIVSGFRYPDDGMDSIDRFSPEMQWLNARLVRYADSSPKANGALPVSYLTNILPKPIPPVKGNFVEGFSNLVQSTEQIDSYFTYRKDPSLMYICRQTEVGNCVEWETASSVTSPENDAEVFVFGGALGYISQPERNGFSLLVNGREALDFDIRHFPSYWKSENGAVSLHFYPRQRAGTQEDAVGIFCVTVKSNRLTVGKPCRLAVRSKSIDSRRWFGLYPFRDVVNNDVRSFVK